MPTDEDLEKFNDLYNRVCHELPNFHPHADGLMCLSCAQVIARIEWSWDVDAVNDVGNAFDFV